MCGVGVLVRSSVPWLRGTSEPTWGRTDTCTHACAVPCRAVPCRAVPCCAVLCCAVLQGLGEVYEAEYLQAVTGAADDKVRLRRVCSAVRGEGRKLAA